MTQRARKNRYENPDSIGCVYEMFLPPATEVLPRTKEDLVKQCTVINPALPARYLLKTKRKDVDGRDEVRRWTLGTNDPTKRNKTLLLLGASGAGKTTMANMMVNFVLGVKWEDDIRFQITDNVQEVGKPEEGTRTVTAYEVFGWEEAELPFSLTIIDTPGIQDRDGMRALVEKLVMLLENERVDQIDAVCHVVKATENRLTEHLSGIFDGVASLLGKDMKKSIITLITHSDGTVPDVLDILANHGIMGDSEAIYFAYNNHLFQSRDDAYDGIYQSAWRDSMSSLAALFETLNVMQHQRSKQTLDVLKDRLRLEDCARQKQVRSEVAATCCHLCEENCHVGCMACGTFFCRVMLRGTCTVCPKRCSHKTHVRKHSRYADNHKTLTGQIAEILQNLRRNALKPDLAPSFQMQITQAREENNKERLLELEEKKKIIAEIMASEHIKYGKV